MKKLLLFLMTMILPMAANADDSGTCGDGLIWVYKAESKTLTISGSGNMENYSWSKMNMPWNHLSADIKIVVFETGVTSIGNSSFFNCSSLTSVTIPQGVTSIGAYAFTGCSNLSSVTVPNSVNGIGESAFSGCKSLKSFIIPDGVNSIISSTFSGCLELTSISIPNSINSIGSYAFYECPNLISVDIPNSVTSIDESAFGYCSGLVSINIPNSVIEIGKEAFASCSSLNRINLPDGLKVIEDRVFGDCHSLNSIVLPNGVEQIGKYAFHRCTNLASINIPNSVKSIEVGAFYTCTNLASISIPHGITSIEDQVFGHCEKLANIDFPNNIESIGEGAFESCNSLMVVNIPNSVTTIKACAFRWCESLISINIPNGVTRIEAESFSGCYKLDEISLPPNLSVIRDMAFKNCKNIKNITIPKSVEYIYQNAFEDCSSVNRITVLATNPPFLYDNSFSDYSVPLKVPKGCKEAYQTAQGWMNFTNISDADKYKLTYMVDGDEYKSYEIEEGSSIIPESVPIKEGYTFSGWSEIPETMPANDVIVTGTFTINKYKLTYSVDGEEYKSYDIEYGSTITSETEPTKEGYTFSGWSDIPETMPAKDVNVTGAFTVNKYKLTYSVDGEEYKSYDIEYGSTITSETEPTKEGYTFSGWSDLPETMPAKDVTVTGTFTINKYKVTYMIDGEVYQTVEVEYGSAITPPNPGDREGYDFAWGDYPSTMPAEDITINGSYTATDIRAIMADESDVKIYNVSGKPLNNLQKGVNIIRTRDGKTKKIMVK